MSPALIGWTVCRELGLGPIVIDAGAPLPPAVPHVRMPLAVPARCLSSGRALDRSRVNSLCRWGRRWGRGLRGRPLLLAECVPGGTSTAAAVLTAFGLEGLDCISGSLRHPPHALRRELISRGLAQALARDSSVFSQGPLAAIAAVGDPMMALAAGLVHGAACTGSPVLLAGGCQMAAVLASALELTHSEARQGLAARVAVVTTSWLADEGQGAFARLMQRLAMRWSVQPLVLASALRFDLCRNPRLLDYERGHIKEGVGAGGFALLWELSGRPVLALATACDDAMDLLK